MLKTIFSVIFQLLKFILVFLSPFFVAIFVIFLLVIFYLLKSIIVDKKRPKGRVNKGVKKDGFFRKLFYLLPKQIASDIIEQDPEAFREFGIHLICGPQGSGKSITLIYLLTLWRQKYPRMKIFSNHMHISFEDGTIDHWKDLIGNRNGIYGTAMVLDEIQTWFSNKESKDMPLEMLGEISQQRKQKKAIIGTAQVFSQISKPIRQQTHFVYIPHTYLNCLTIVFKTRAEYYNPEKDKFRKYNGFFFFVHTKELRNSYDTFQKIERYKDTDFEFNPQLLDGASSALGAVER